MNNTQQSNSQWKEKKTKFTMEREENKKLAFLDMQLTRVNNKIDVSVYRKATNTDQYITNDSNCPVNTKRSALNIMVYRMCNLPLSAINFMNELKTIKRIAQVNGYSDKLIDGLVEKHSKQLRKKKRTTFIEQQRQNRIYVPFNFIPAVTNHLKPIFQKIPNKLGLK